MSKGIRAMRSASWVCWAAGCVSSVGTIEVHDQLADRALQTVTLRVFEGRIVEWPAAERVLGAAEEARFPRLDLGDGQSVSAGGRSCGRRTTQDLQHQGNPGLGRPALEGFVVGWLPVIHQFTFLSDPWSVCHNSGLTAQGAV
jgi:hypothetical protein